jgi:hypothetical protein
VDNEERVMKIYAIRCACFDPSTVYDNDVVDKAVTAHTAWASGLEWEELIYEIKEPLSLDLLVKVLNRGIPHEWLIYWVYKFGTGINIEREEWLKNTKLK